jgi:hypothetical protein
LSRMMLRPHQNPCSSCLSEKGNYSREQRNELRRLREDGDRVKLHSGRDRRRRLLTL